MRKPWPFISAMALASAIAVPFAKADSPNQVDERDPAYQQALEHFSGAAAALAVARKELEAAKSAYALPGVSVERLRDQLTPIEDTLAVLLTPERKRFAHTTVVPDGTFFVPAQTGE